MDSYSIVIWTIIAVLTLIFIVGILAAIQVVKGIKERRRNRPHVLQERIPVSYYQTLGGMDIVFYEQKQHNVVDPKANKETGYIEGIILLEQRYEVKVKYKRTPLQIIDSHIQGI